MLLLHASAACCCKAEGTHRKADALRPTQAGHGVEEKQDHQGCHGPSGRLIKGGKLVSSIYQGGGRDERRQHGDQEKEGVEGRGERGRIEGGRE